MRSFRNYESDRDTFSAKAYQVKQHPGIAWHVLGWETEPDEDTEWSGYEQRTGKVTVVMVGDDRKFTFDPEDLVPIEDDDFCGCCGQIGCAWR